MTVYNCLPTIYNQYIKIKRLKTITAKENNFVSEVQVENEVYSYYEEHIRNVGCVSVKKFKK